MYTDFVNLWDKQKHIIHKVIFLVSLILVVLILVAITLSSLQNGSRNLRCNVCGSGFNYSTWLGDYYGGHCTNGSFGDRSEECGADSACFKMNHMLSDKMRKTYQWLKGHYRNNSHHFSNHFLFTEGTIRGCIKGFGWVNRCHFFNESRSMGENKHLYWQATNMCVCTTDNCN